MRSHSRVHSEGVEKSRLTAIMFVLLGCIWVGAAHARGGVMLEGFQMSPDGSTVAFQYQETGSKRHGVGLLNWRTGALTPIRVAPGIDLGTPSFSQDGKRLVAIMGAPPQIVIIDLATMSIETVTPGPDHRTLPVFQPGTNHILYVYSANSGRKHYRLLNPADHTEKRVLDERDYFNVFLSRAYFIGPEEIIFQGTAPADDQLRESVARRIGTPFKSIAYRLRFGQRAEFLLPDVLLREQPSGRSGGSFFSASGGGRTIIFIGRSESEPQSPSGDFNYEIFRFENDELTQMTNLRSHLAYAHLAYDGSAVAFGSDPTRRRDFDLFVLDLKNGEVRPTGLRDRLAAHPEFALR